MGCFTCVMSNMRGNGGNPCNKYPKQLVEQNCSYNDYFDAIFGFTSHSRAPAAPVTEPWSFIVTNCHYFVLSEVKT